MNCKNVESSLSAYVDNELTGRDMLQVRDHLAACPACREELDVVESVKRLMSATPVPEPVIGFEDRLVANVLAATARPEPAQRRTSFVFLSGVAAASMVATFVVLQFLHARTEANVVATQRTDDMAYEVVQRDRALSSAADPLGGSPVMMPIDGRR